MIDQQLGLELHDRFTRGLSLTKSEHLQLEQWYVEQDSLEAQDLNLSETPTSVLSLQVQVEAALHQITLLTQQIQQIISDNQQLKIKNEQLSIQVAQLYGSKAA